MKKVIVIGSGIIGVSTGIALQEAGFKVLIVDKNQTTLKASEGNAGAFALSDIIPLATPGILRSAPGWLIDPLGPLSIRLPYFFSIAPWLLKFWRASWRDQFPSLMRAQSELMALSREALERRVDLCRLEPFLRRSGQLKLYDDEASFRASTPLWDALEKHAISHELLRSAAQIKEIQPGIAPQFRYAGYTPDWINVTNPKSWLKSLNDHFLRSGGTVEHNQAIGLTGSASAVTVHCVNKALDGDFVVVAAGAWSKSLAKTVGDNLPLDTERGYNTTFDAGVFDLRTHLTFADHGFAVSQIDHQVRVGGAVELGGLRAKPNFDRSKVMLSKAKQFLPNLEVANAQEWMGFRPSMPDSLPVIGQSPNNSRIIYAFGHGHLGLTQSTATAELVRASILGNPWPINPAPFSAKRFKR